MNEESDDIGGADLDSIAALIDENGDIRKDEPAAEQETPSVEQETQPEQTEVRRIKAKVDGNEIEVTEPELIEHYQKYKSADKRLQEASEQLKGLDTHRKQLSEAAQYFQMMAQQMLGPKPDPAMLDSDPVTYLKAQQAYNERVSQIAQAQAAQAHLQESQSKERAVQDAEALSKERALLLKEMPHWADSEKSAAEHAKIMNFMRARGNSEERIAQQLNRSAADVLAYRDAMLYREILAKTKELSKQVSKLPSKVERPGVSLDGRSSAAQRHMKEGSIESAAALISGLI